MRRNDVAMVDVFISHAQSDSDFACQVASDLVQQGVTVWALDNTLEPGEDLVRGVEEGIRMSRNLLVVLSRKSGKSDWLRAETALALSHPGKRVVPIFAEKGAEIPFLLRFTRGVDLSDSSRYARSIRDLSSSLLEDSGPNNTEREVQYSSRILKARLEAITLEQERLHLELENKFRARAFSTIAAAVTIGTVVVSLFGLTGAAWEDLESTVAVIIGIVSGMGGSMAALLVARNVARRWERIKRADK